MFLKREKEMEEVSIKNFINTQSIVNNIEINETIYKLVKIYKTTKTKLCKKTYCISQEILIKGNYGRTVVLLVLSRAPSDVLSARPYKSHRMQSMEKRSLSSYPSDGLIHLFLKRLLVDLCHCNVLSPSGKMMHHLKILTYKFYCMRIRTKAILPN